VRGFGLIAGFVVSVALAGCAGALPGGEAGLASQSMPMAVAAVPAGPAAGSGSADAGRGVPQVPGAARPASVGTVITGFRGQHVVLYYSESGKDGEMVSSQALPLPMRYGPTTVDAGRLQVMTVQGPRWVARHEAVIE